ncbi:MAG: hypothetical protein DCF16_19260 [Alphaproteobacteria bacterium]|nr:MAG: hypothetical protein DCF16_19260 [Alphaproteobacteria bacterium]
MPGGAGFVSLDVTAQRRHGIVAESLSDPELTLHFPVLRRDKQIMSRYFFHLWTRDGYEIDDTGIELEDAEAAYLEAFYSAREISIEMLRSKRNATRYRYDVVDCQGRLVHEVLFAEAMGQPLAKNPASGFVASASRGCALASDLAREIATARQNLQTCRELLAVTPASVKQS